MPLSIAHESEIVNQREYDGGAIKGNQVQVKRASTSASTTTHTPSYRNTEDFFNPEVDGHDGLTETEEDDNDPMVDLALKNPARFSEVMALERPTWKGSGGIVLSRPAKLSSRQSIDSLDTFGGPTGHTSADATPVPTPTQLPTTPGTGTLIAELSVESVLPTETPVKRRVMPESPESPVPVLRVDTDLIFADGSTKLMLTNQRPLIRVIVQDAIENLRASLLFQNAFPDANVAFTLTRDALGVAAENHKPGGAIVQWRLQADDEYMARLVSLPRARISHFRAEVKERCNAVSVAAFFAIGSAPEIAQVVQRQLSIYTYTFPIAFGGMGANGPVRRSQPYRNDRIIAVIRDLYFSGGSTSFAARFEHLFPTYQGANGVVNREVPIPMVALVATALYATLYEWRTGEQQSMEFSANAYMDVYLGHVNTFNHILENREGAFHTMMSDIYTRASAPTTGTASVPIAELDLDTLDE
ncbi:hypothetical protein BJY52DRAFT_1200336 [Lactarius psammicola]|nr:hypothetical protein BJY52DRAFT_1200336 [Lactarius psammicola]